MFSNIKKNIGSIYDEFFGEPTHHPLVTRLVAFLIDLVLYLLVGYLLLLAEFKYTLLTISLDVIICAAYFTMGYSKVWSGQTLGKKVMKIKVVDNAGNFLPWKKALLRSVPVVLLLNSYQIMTFIVTEQISLYYVFFTLYTIIFFGSFYFPVVKTDRQGIHDLLVSSHVIPEYSNTINEIKINWKLLVGFLIIVTLYLDYMLN